MFFGLCGSPLTFQAFMNYNFADYIRKGWLVIYMDNLAISATSERDKERKICLVLQQFCNLGLSLKLSKCEFSKTEVKFLGMVVGHGCIHMDPAKLSAIMTWPLLKTVKAVWSFLGFCNFYCRFIPNFSNTAVTFSPSNPVFLSHWLIFAYSLIHHPSSSLLIKFHIDSSLLTLRSTLYYINPKYLPCIP